MMRRFLLFLILPLALGCQKNATAQATHSAYQALTECFRQWPSETGITGMTFENHYNKTPLDAFLVHDVLRLPLQEGFTYMPGNRVHFKGYTAFFLTRIDSLREGCEDYLLCTFTAQGQPIDQYVCARERYEFADGEDVIVRLPELAGKMGDTLSFHVREYMNTGYNIDLEQGRYLCRRTRIRISPQGRILHDTPETYPAYSHHEHGPDDREVFHDDLPYASNTDFLRDIYGITGYYQLQNSFWLARHTSLQLRERLADHTDWEKTEAPLREYNWEQLAGILPGEDTYWSAELNDIHSYQGRKDEFLVSLRSRKENRNTRPDIVTVLRIALDYNNGNPIITDLEWLEDHRPERKTRVVDFLRELYTPLKQNAAGHQWKFQDEAFVQKHSTPKFWKKLTSPPKGVQRWWAFDSERKQQVTVRDERMLIDIVPGEPYTYSVKYLDGGDLYVTHVKADLIDGRVLINDMDRGNIRPVSFEVAFGPDSSMLGRVIGREKDQYKLRYVKKVFNVPADSVTTQVRSAYKGQGRLFPEESDTVLFHEHPSMGSPVTDTVVFAKSAKAYADCLGYAQGWFKTFVNGKECYVRADKMHWMYYYNTQEKAQMKPKQQSKELNDVWSGVAEEPAQFPGGDAACLRFLQENAQMPELLETWGLYARVIVSFIVDVDGTISGAQAVHTNLYQNDNSPVKTLDEESRNTVYEQSEMEAEAEALRLVGLMPRWKPATLAGKPVKSRFNIPIMFRGQQAKEKINNTYNL